MCTEEDCAAMYAAMSNITEAIDRRRGVVRPLKLVWVMFLGCRHEFDEESSKKYLAAEVAPRNVDTRVFCDPSPTSDQKAYWSLMFSRPLGKDSAYIRRVVDAVADDMQTHDVIMMGNSYGGGVATRAVQHLAQRPNTRHIMNRLKLRTFGAIYCKTKGIQQVDTIHYMYNDDIVSLRACGMEVPDDDFFQDDQIFKFDPETKVAWIKNLFFDVRAISLRARNAGRLIHEYQEVHRSYKFVWQANMQFIKSGKMDVHKTLTPEMVAHLHQVLQQWNHIGRDDDYEPDDEFVNTFRKEMWKEHECELEYNDKGILKSKTNKDVIDFAYGAPPESLDEAKQMCKKKLVSFHPRKRKGECIKAGVNEGEVYQRIVSACDAISEKDFE
jgi:hypothetical protein